MSAQSAAVTSTDDELKQFVTLASDRLSFGADPADVAEQLVSMGLSEGAAKGLVAKVAQQVGTEKEAKRRPSDVREAPKAPARRRTRGTVSIPMVIVGATVAALLGAGAWGFIAAATGYELGLVAWAIGGLTGFGAVMFANGHADARIQTIAVVASLGGILMGKYLSFLSLYNELAAELATVDPELLEEFAEDPEFNIQLTELSFTSGFSAFMEWGMMIGFIDILWIFFAVSTAWKIAAGDRG